MALEAETLLSSTLRQYSSTNRSLDLEAESILFKANQGIARQQGIDLTIFSGEKLANKEGVDG